VRFKGFGRCGTGTDPEHRFTFETIKPGPIGDGQAPHVNVTLFMRGMLSHAYTRMYFDDEAEANARDPVLAGVEEARRRTLIAARETTASGTVYRFDVHMQGPNETVFFDV
jgi:protocatechuate 3,4-dioxygenase, alpha subunit